MSVGIFSFLFFFWLVWMNVGTYSPILEYLTYWLSTNCYFVKRKCQLSDREGVLIWILFPGPRSTHEKRKKKNSEGAVTCSM